MVDTLAGIVRADLEELHFDDADAARRWRTIADDNDFAALVARAVRRVPGHRGTGRSGSVLTRRPRRDPSWILPGPTGWSMSAATAG